jgi:hypothetical protein
MAMKGPAQFRPQRASSNRAELVDHLGQRAQLVERVQGGVGPDRVDAFEEFRPDERGRDRAGQPGPVGQAGPGCADEHKVEHGRDLAHPQAQRPPRRLDQLRVALGAGQQLGQHRHVAQPALLLVPAPAEGEQLAQGAHRGETGPVARHAGPRGVQTGLGEQRVEAAAVVEDERLVDPGGGGHGTGRHLGDTQAAKGLRGTVEERGPGIRHGASDRSGATLPHGPRRRPGPARLERPLKDSQAGRTSVVRMAR